MWRLSPVVAVKATVQVVWVEVVAMQMAVMMELSALAVTVMQRAIFKALLSPLLLTVFLPCVRGDPFPSPCSGPSYGHADEDAASAAETGGAGKKRADGGPPPTTVRSGAGTPVSSSGGRDGGTATQPAALERRASFVARLSQGTEERVRWLVRGASGRLSAINHLV